MISQEEIKHIAQLAHLALEPAELKKMEKELSLILDYFNSLKEVDVSKVKPAFYSKAEKDLSLSEITREDIAKKETGQDKILKDSAPATEENFIKVKKVI